MSALRLESSEAAMALLREHMRFKTSLMPTRDGASIESLLMKHGKEWMGRKRPKGLRKMRDKECFVNAQMLAVFHPDEYTYCEGLAHSIIAVNHGWVIDRDGNIIDPTWRDPHKCAYIGVPFKTEYIRRVITKTGHWISLWDNYMQMWPLLTGEVKLEEVMDERRI
jgi:hypothetical protein